MKQIEIEFIYKLQESMVDIQEITNINASCECIKALSTHKNEIDFREENKKIIIYAQVNFDIEYIPKDMNEFKCVEISKFISDCINLEQESYNINNINRQVNIEDVEGRVIDGRTIIINSILNILI